MVKFISFCFSLVFLGGCALPPAISIVSLMFDGVSYARTGKSISDHAISEIAAADCAIWYGFVEGQFCHDELAADPILTASAAIDSGPAYALRNGADAVAFGNRPSPFRLTDDRWAYPR